MRIRRSMGSGAAMRLEFHYLPPMNTAHTRRHWSVAHREARRAKDHVWAAIHREKPQKPLERAHVVCTRFSSRQPDHENLAMSFKAWIDALVHHGVIVDDDPGHLTREYRWIKAKRGEGRICMEVTSV